MSESPLALAAPSLLAAGYHVMPILPPSAEQDGRGKAPGAYQGGQWRGMSSWQRFRDRTPTPFETGLWANWPDANVGIVLGSPAGVVDGRQMKVLASDVDTTDPDEFDEIVRCLPRSPMAKKGAKGVTLFYRGPVEIKSKGYSVAKRRLVDLLTGSQTRQTVMPPSVHPEGMAYVWQAGPVPAHELPVFDEDALAVLEETLEGLGWGKEITSNASPDNSLGPVSTSKEITPRDPEDPPTVWRDLNDEALAKLGEWVPGLDLYGLRPARGGYEAVATWRSSSTGQALEKRKRNLKIHSDGIRDFGDDRTFTALDLIQAARECDLDTAFGWLSARLGRPVAALTLQATSLAVLQPAALVEHVDTVTGEVVEIDPLIRPYVWRDPTTIPTRQFVYGHHFIRKFISCTFAPGGVGKSALGLAEAVAMASGRGLLGVTTAERLRVWVWSGEDPQEETDRRLAGIYMHYQLTRRDLEGWLFMGSGRETSMVVATLERNNVRIAVPQVDRVKALMKQWRIDVAIIDPFVSTHRVTENDNGAIDLVAKEWGRIADETNAAVDLVHHTSKPTAGQEITVEHGRGASALLYAARSARVLNPMSSDEARSLGVHGPGAHRSYFRVDNGKANLVPAPERAAWLHFHSVKLGNGGLEGGDNIGVVESWEPARLEFSPDQIREVQERCLAGAWRLNPQAKDWVGNLLAETLDLDLQEPSTRTTLKAIITDWMRDGWLKTETRLDAHREPKPFITAGELV